MTKAGLLTGKGERRGAVTKHNRWQLSAAIWGALTNPRDRPGRSGLRVGGGGRRAADAVQLRARLGGPRRTLPSCEALGVRGSPPAAPLAPHPAGLSPPRQVAAGLAPRQGLHAAGEASRWLSSVPCRLPAPGCAQEGSLPWDTDPTKLPGRCY